MDSPFQYNKYVTGQHFIGRKEDCGILMNLLSNGENVVLWEPTGTGKKSVDFLFISAQTHFLKQYRGFPDSPAD